MQLTSWLVETIFFHFLRQQLTAASANSLFFNWNIVFNQSFIPGSGNQTFVHRKRCCFIPSFFLPVETIIEIPTSGQKYFWFYKRSFKKKQFFCVLETQFSLSFIRLVQTDIFFGRKQYSFWLELFFC